MSRRGVDPAAAEWDAWRAGRGPWTVVVRFAAGGRERQGSWTFDPSARTVSAADDEARWLSEDESATDTPVPSAPFGPARGSSSGPTSVYDVEAEGGLSGSLEPRKRSDGPVDLMTAMRERSSVRGRRGGARRRGTTPTEVPVPAPVPEEALPLEQLAFDPEVHPPPPAAHTHPRDDPHLLVGLPEGSPPAPMPAQPAVEAAHDQTDQDQTEQDQTERADREAPKPTDKGRGRSRKAGRTAVPSWDDVMFGTPKGD